MKIRLQLKILLALGLSTNSFNSVANSFSNHDIYQDNSGMLPNPSYYPNYQFPPLMQEYGSNPYYNNKGRRPYPKNPEKKPPQKFKPRFPPYPPYYP